MVFQTSGANSIVSASRFRIASAPNYALRDFADMPSSNLTRWKIHNVSDPFIIFDSGYYWCFSTDYMVNEGTGPTQSGAIPLCIQVRRSPDLIKWEWYGTALNALPSDAAAHVSGATKAWAPHVEKIGNTFYLYYSASLFGTTQSFIGLLTSSSITGPWSNAGEVLKTSSGSTENAIDPNITTDKDGNKWMVYGSYNNGIFLVRINNTTGKILTGATTFNIARRASGSPAFGAVEGAYIIYRPENDKYYLFVSYGQCCLNNSEPAYNIRVFRSSAITGPYVDFDDQSATDTASTPSNAIGNKALGGYKFGASNGWIYTGHNAIFKKGQDYFTCHHARLDFDFPWNYLHVRKIAWSANGWPLFLPQRYAGEVLQVVSANAIAGTYQHVSFSPTTDTQQQSISITLSSNGTLSTTANPTAGFWTRSGTNTVELNFESQTAGVYFTDTCQMYSGWDWENGTPTLMYAGLSQFGVHVMGKKV